MVTLSGRYSTPVPKSPTELIRLALEVAASVHSPQDLPIAAIITDSSGSVVASSKNAVVQTDQPTAHAEMLVIAGLGMKTLKRDAAHMTMSVTLEPCPMCAWAIRSAGIGRLIFGAYNQQYGAAGSVYDLLRDSRHGRRIEVLGGVLEHECKQLLGDAFSDIRDNGVR